MKSLPLVLVLLAGCDMYFPGGDDDECKDTPVIQGGDVAYPNYRDPSTGQCEAISQPPYCNSACEPCPEYTSPPRPDWGTCNSYCSGLDEASCIEQEGCFAAYADDSLLPSFIECWQVAPSGPVHGSCAQLGAYECSRHDDCVAYYSGGRDQMKFSRCENELAMPTPSSCTSLGEQACSVRSDCVPVYEGDDCTCVPGHCSCEIQTYDHCQSI